MRTESKPMSSRFRHSAVLAILALATLAVTTACIYPEGGYWGGRGGGHRDHGGYHERGGNQRHDYRPG